MSKSVLAITGLSNNIFEVKKLLGEVSGIVLWIDWDHEYGLFPKPFDFSPSVKHADKLVFVFGDADSYSCQLMAHLTWLNRFTPPNCERYIFGLPNTCLAKENVFEASSDAIPISLDELKKMLGN